MYQSYFKEEEVNISKIIKDVIETKWSGSNEEQMKIVSLLRGLATSDDPLANKFMKALDDATSNLKPEDYK